MSRHDVELEFLLTSVLHCPLQDPARDLLLFQDDIAGYIYTTKACVTHTLLVVV